MNADQFVDFEMVLRLNGTLIVNTLAHGQGLGKRLVTKISHDNGVTWNYLTPPGLDSQRRVFECGDSCNLHLHGLTERRDLRDQFSSAGAPGFMIGVGNVGPVLLPKSECDTFLSNDGGRTWTEIAKEAHFVEIGMCGLCR
jgi:Sortilin, neurotensin receptor 3,